MGGGERNEGGIPLVVIIWEQLCPSHRLAVSARDIIVDMWTGKTPDQRTPTPNQLEHDQEKKEADGAGDQTHL